MKLNKAEFTEAYPIARLTSENNVWEVGIPPASIRGFRVAANKVGSQSYEIYYWCGADQGTTLATLAIIVAIMGQMPESVSYPDFKKAFPVQNIEPITDDRECWDSLLELVNREAS